jgi:hypothetical protein
VDQVDGMTVEYENINFIISWTKPAFLLPSFSVARSRRWLTSKSVKVSKTEKTLELFEPTIAQYI